MRVRPLCTLHGSVCAKRRGTLFCAFPLFRRDFGEVAEQQLRSCWLTVEPRDSQLLASANKEADQEYFRLALAVFLESALCDVTKCNHRYLLSWFFGILYFTVSRTYITAHRLSHALGGRRSRPSAERCPVNSWPLPSPLRPSTEIPATAVALPRCPLTGPAPLPPQPLRSPSSTAASGIDRLLLTMFSQSDRVLGRAGGFSHALSGKSGTSRRRMDFASLFRGVH